VESMRHTSAGCEEDKLITELRGRLAELRSVRSTHFLRRGSALSVWVGIRDHDRSARYALYELEDRIPYQFPNVKIDFHVVPISPGSSLEAFIAAAWPDVRRQASQIKGNLHVQLQFAVSLTVQGHEHIPPGRNRAVTSCNERRKRRI